MLPAYWVTLAVVVAIAQPPVRTVVAQALTVQTYLPGADIDAFSQSWSIPTELSFYIVLPLVVWLLERARRRDPDLPVLLLVGSAVLATVALAFVTVGTIGEDVLIERGCPPGGRTSRSAWCSPSCCCGPRAAGPSPPDGWPGTRWAAWCWPGAGVVLATTPIAGLLTLGPVAGVQLSARLALSTAAAGLLLPSPVLGRDDAYSAALASRPARNVGVGVVRTVPVAPAGFRRALCLDGSTGVRRRHRAAARGRPADQPVPGAAEPRRRRTPCDALGGTAGAAPASTPAAMTASVTVASTHG